MECVIYLFIQKKIIKKIMLVQFQYAAQFHLQYSVHAFTSTACDPVQEGHSATLTCTARAENCMNVFKMTWQADDRKVVACTSSLCGSLYTSRDKFKTSISAINDNNNFITSTMKITNVSRISPFNMETQWACAICADWKFLECNKLQIYGRSSLFSFEIEQTGLHSLFFL